MAGRIAGITIEIGGDTSNLQKSLKGVDKELKKTQASLKDVNKLLKLDPGNTELLTQKQKNLEKAIGTTKTRLNELKNAQAGVAQSSDEWDALQREIIATEQDLKSLEKEYSNFGSVGAQQVAAAGKKMQEVGNSISGLGQKLAPVSAAAAGLVASLASLGYKAITSADDLNTLSKQTGISTDDLQKMSYAADLVDVSVEDITGALKKMKAKMDPTNETFKKLGVSVTNADGSMRSATDVFYDSIKALSQVENETERDQLAMDLFGKSADSLAGIIDDGGAALKAYGEEAEAMGLILSGETLNDLNTINDMVDKLKANFRGAFAKVGATLATTFAPALEKAAAFAQNLADKIAGLTPEQLKLVTGIAAVVAAIAPLLIAGGKLVVGIGKVMEYAPMIKTAITGVTAALASPVAAIAILVAAVVAVGVIIYKNWDKIKAWTENLAKSLKAAWTNAKTNITNAVNNIETNVTNAWNNIKTTVTTTVSNIVTTITSKFNAAKATVVGIFNGIKSSISNAINGAKDAVSRAIEAIKGFFNFTFQWPHIPLPHFAIDPPGWKVGDLLKGTIPSLGINWYAKAYDNPMMFTSPTVLQTPQGLKGFGDGHGAEIVLGLNKLRELVGSTGGVTINVYPPAGANVEQIAAAVEQKLVAAQQRRIRVYA